jgi:hypothetical protein
MIYTPSKNPKEALIIVCVIAGMGILGGILVNRFFMFFALVFWMQYTAVLTYIQFKAKSGHKKGGLTALLLKPQLRFFLFEFIATIGLLSVLMHDWWEIGTAVLVVWVLFAINFYRHYTQYKKYE